MSQQPQLSIPESFVEGRSCSICGHVALSVTKLEKLPDYVGCSNCRSAFVLEEGGVRVMYGSIPADYPETRDFALKQWTSLEAIEALAEAERDAPSGPPAVSLPSGVGIEIQEMERVEPQPDPAVPAVPPFESAPQDEQLEVQAEFAAVAEEAAVPAPSVAVPDEAEALESGGVEPAASMAQEPSPGQRFRVRYAGAARIIFPDVACAHCMRSPAERNLIVMGQLATPSGELRRQPFTMPLCTICYARARARSDEASSARQLAHLISALVAVVLVVAALALGLTDFQDRPLVSGALIGLLALVGYGFPALILLGRAGRMPPAPDALFVRSTLMISPQPGEGETFFDWRNQAYAELFKQTNGDAAVGEITEIEDAFPAQSPEPPAGDPITEE